jgi:hypothetical protein
VFVCVVCACVWCLRARGVRVRACRVVCACGVVCVFLKMKEHLPSKLHAADDLQHAVADRLNRLAADR